MTLTVDQSGSKIECPDLRQACRSNTISPDSHEKNDVSVPCTYFHWQDKVQERQAESETHRVKTCPSLIHSALSTIAEAAPAILQAPTFPSSVHAKHVPK